MCKLFEEIHSYNNNKFIHEIRNSIQCIMGQLVELKSGNNKDSNFTKIFDQLRRLELVCLELENNKEGEKND